MTRKKDRHCRVCGKECFGKDCLDCFKKGHHGSITLWRRNRRKKDE